MDQYYPAGKVGPRAFDEINRRLAPAEYSEALELAREMGFRHLDARRPHPRLAARLAAL